MDPTTPRGPEGATPDVLIIGAGPVGLALACDLLMQGVAVRLVDRAQEPAANDPQGADKAKAELLLLKQQIEQQVTAGLAKLPANTDALAKEQARTKLLDEAFAATAREKSACPSKQQGGDVDWFPRSGGMVEPFTLATSPFAAAPGSSVANRRGLMVKLNSEFPLLSRRSPADAVIGPAGPGPLFFRDSLAVTCSGSLITGGWQLA